MNKFFDLLSVLVVLAFILFNIIESPPRYLIANEKAIQMQIEDQEETVDAFYTWEQDSWNILQVFHFFPSKKQICLYNEDLDVKWAFDEYPNIAIDESQLSPFNIPLWKYWLATITLGIALLLLYIIYIIKSIYNYRIAAKENTFRSYKNYLVKSFIPKFLRLKAGLKLKTKIGVYKSFVEIVTRKTSGDLKEVIFKIIDSITETGNIKVNTQFEFETNIILQKEFLQNNMDSINKVINQTTDNESFNKWKEDSLKEAISTNNNNEVDILTKKVTSKEILKKALDIKKKELSKKLSFNYADLRESFTNEKNTDRKILFKNYLNELFKVIFPEQIITVEYDCDSLITFHLKSITNNKDTFQFWEKDEGSYFKDITLLPDIKCSWEFYVSIKHQDSSENEYVSKTISATTTYPPYYKNNEVEDYYTFIVMSAFANFNKEIADAFGMKRESNSINKNESISSTDLYTLFENKISEFINDDIPTSLLEEFYGDYESSLDGLLISEEYLDLMFSGLDAMVSTAKEMYEGVDFIKETIQNS